MGTRFVVYPIRQYQCSGCFGSPFPTPTLGYQDGPPYVIAHINDQQKYMGFHEFHLQVKLFLQKPSSTQERIGGVAGDKFHQQSPFLLKRDASLNVFFHCHVCFRGCIPFLKPAAKGPEKLMVGRLRFSLEKAYSSGI